MMRVFALSVGAVVAIAAGFNATAIATSQGANNQNPKTNQSKSLEKREDGHTLIQKWLKVKDNKKSAFYHFNEIKDTDPDVYQETSKEDRHYHSNTKTTVVVDGQEQTTKRVVVYNINKNKTICNIVEHSETGVTKDGDCNDEKDVSTPVVPNTDGDNPEVDEPKDEPKDVDPKEEQKDEVTPQPKVEVKQEQEETPVEVTSTDEGKGGPTPEVLPNTGASPISGTLIALFAAIATFIGYTSSLALMEYRIKSKY